MSDTHDRERWRELADLLGLPPDEKEPAAPPPAAPLPAAPPAASRAPEKPPEEGRPVAESLELAEPVAEDSFEPAEYEPTAATAIPLSGTETPEPVESQPSSHDAESPDQDWPRAEPGEEDFSRERPRRGRRRGRRGQRGDSNDRNERGPRE